MSESVLIANRGEIAIRISRAAAELGWTSIAVQPADDGESVHGRKTDRRVTLGRAGPAAYLDAPGLIEAAVAAGARYIHPGYGFLSERADFARMCADAGPIFVGPAPQTLELLGDKARARDLAARCGVPVPRGIGAISDPSEARALLESLRGAPIMIKAVAGGGGRGIRLVREASELEEAIARCRSEAAASFGSDAVYAEEFFGKARHVEVQVAGDRSGQVMSLGERECTLQRRHQKLVEIAPSAALDQSLRTRLCEAAVRMAQELRYVGLGTFEFLVRPRAANGDPSRFVFIEANPRLQVEHTVTEAVFGIDLVQLQLRVAAGDSLRQIVGDRTPVARGSAMQLRINMEQLRPDGSLIPAVGTLQTYDLPSGPGIRVDGCGHVGFRNDPRYDSLLAKLVIHSNDSDWTTLLRKAYRAICETQITGIATNVPFLRNLLRHPAVAGNQLDTRFVEDQLATLLQAPEGGHPSLHGPEAPARADRQTGAMDAVQVRPEGTIAVGSPAAGRVIDIRVEPGDGIQRGQTLVIVESMKNEFVVEAQFGTSVVAVLARVGDAVDAEQPLLYLVEVDQDARLGESDLKPLDLETIRPDLQEVLDAHAALQDAARPDAVARRRATAQRTARENLEDLCDPDSFTEYGALAVAAQRSRRTVEELQRISPADGLITGIGTVNGALFDKHRTRCVIFAYDYTVFAGTQGYMAHEKKRRMLRLALKWRLPVVLFGEGGGGRPGDTDNLGGLRLFNPTFWGFARLGGEVPVVGVVSGRCFAGNAALVAVCDVIIATENSSIGMGGPAMIEGGGLGVVAAEDVGPVSVQSRNGVIDIVVRDESEAVQVARRYLSYFQGRMSTWTCADQRLLRHVIPEDPRRMYDIREVIRLLADSDSVLELRPHFGHGFVTALIRIEGYPFAVLANNPAHLSGAIDAEASDKAATFIDLARAFGLPILSLCDTPGFMVGPAAEADGLVRRAGRMFTAGARISGAHFTVVVRKAYGLGAVAMVGGNAHEQMFAVAWPTGHFGKMGLEGYVKLAYRKELDAIADPAARRQRVNEMVNAMHEKGTALKTAPFLSIDDVIDPMQTRRWLVDGLITTRQQRDEPSGVPLPQAMW